MRNSETGLLEIKKYGLIRRMIEALVLDGGTEKANCILDKDKLLGKDDYVMQVSSQFSYSIFVGNILYLYIYTCPDNFYAVNFSERCMFGNNHHHDLLLKIVGHHLK